MLLSIGETFSGAKAIQVWLNLCARLITKAIPPERLPVVMDASGQPMVQLSKDQVKKEQMTSVIWTTPLGLPIVQPYRKIARKQVKTKVQSIYISDPNAPSEGLPIHLNLRIIRSYNCDSELSQASLRVPSQFHPQS